jgi:hypothetical protein
MMLVIAVHGHNCKQRNDEAIYDFTLDCFAELVIGPRGFARVR